LNNYYLSASDFDSNSLESFSEPGDLDDDFRHQFLNDESAYVVLQDMTEGFIGQYTSYQVSPSNLDYVNGFGTFPHI
jgi:hypothetical protein